ncbi:phosphatase PAP2 family protein [Desertimonas flava]|jgi:hypothetical protein|uniref:phosphatase PAP2 family protein n=1 Tax=Desertimonas flava TaxID=2064846 RepID=UPI000E34F74A|nr:phosphatase PAP2 family protein [Desertimonas flava]
MQAATDPAVATRRPRLYWWKEALFAAAFYVVYSWIRNRFGSAGMDETDRAVQAFTNAKRVIRLEELLGLFHEQRIQEFFLRWPTFIRAMNIYYGTAHFVVTIAVFALLFIKRPAVFPQWRNTLAVMTGLAIAGFALFPLMPPRLLDVPCEDFGAACLHDGSFGFVDTLKVHGGLWSFDSGGMAAVSNQYAAMPSLHIGWSTWCAVAMWPLLRRRWQRVAVLAYPLLTLFCIIVTANHFWLDGAGGLLVFFLGLLAGWGLHRWNQDRLDRRELRRHGLTLPVVPPASTPVAALTDATERGAEPAAVGGHRDASDSVARDVAGTDP